MRVGVMLVVTGIAMLAMAWIDPVGAILITVGALTTAVALDGALRIEAGDATPLDVRSDARPG